MLDTSPDVWWAVWLDMYSGTLILYAVHTVQAQGPGSMGKLPRPSLQSPHWLRAPRIRLALPFLLYLPSYKQITSAAEVGATQHHRFLAWATTSYLHATFVSRTRHAMPRYHRHRSN